MPDTEDQAGSWEYAAVTWRKSTWSHGSSNCVEVARLPGRAAIAVRDSKVSEDCALRFTSSQWFAFVATIRRDDFNR